MNLDPTRTKTCNAPARVASQRGMTTLPLVALLTAIVAGGCRPPADVPHDAPPPIDGSGPDGPPDAGPVEPPPLERGQAGGETGAIAIAGGFAYVGVGPRLAIWDIASAVPVRVGETEPLSGIVTGVAIGGARAFVTSTAVDDGGVHVIDIADPAKPVPTAFLRLGAGAYSQPRAIAVSGSTAYIADHDQGVFRVDITVPDAPVVVAAGTTFNAFRIQPVGSQVHVLGRHLAGLSVQTLDATDLEPLGSAVIKDVLDGTLTPSGLLVTRGATGFAVDHLAFPGAPIRVYEDPAVWPWAMVAGDGGAWLTVNGHLRFLDLADPSSITLSEASPPITWATSAGAFVGDRLAVVTHQGLLETFAVGPASATALGRAVTGPCASCSAVAGDGERLAIADSTPGAVGTVAAVRASDLDPLGQHAVLSADFEDIAHANGTAYVADWFTGLRVFDLSDPTAPTPTAQVVTGGHPSAIAVAGDRVYLGEGTGGGMLRVFHRGGVSGPVELGAIPTSRVADLAVTGELVYVADATPALRIYDTGDPAAIELVGSYGACSSPVGVAVQGVIAVLGCSSGFHVLDVANPSAPSLLAIWQSPAPTRARAVAIDGARVYYGHDGGVSVIDLTDPAAPVPSAELRTAWHVRHLTVPAPGRVVASTSRAGVYQWAFDGPAAQLARRTRSITEATLPPARPRSWRWRATNAEAAARRAGGSASSASRSGPREARRSGVAAPRATYSKANG